MTTDKTSTAPVIHIERSTLEWWLQLVTLNPNDLIPRIKSRLDAPNPDVVGGDVVAKARDIIKRLRDTPNWLKEPWGDFKSAGANRFDRAPKEAADLIETLIAAQRVQGDADDSADLRWELEDMVRAYVRLLEVGRDRIVDLGGSCDPLDVMEQGDPNLIRAKRALAAQPKGDSWQTIDSVVAQLSSDEAGKEALRLAREELRADLAAHPAEQTRGDGVDLLKLIRDARHRICNDAPSGIGGRPFDHPVYGPLLRRLDEADAYLSTPQQAVPDGVAKDAARYRWLKDQKIVRAHPMQALFKGETRILANATIEFNGDYTYVVKGSLPRLDEAIDAAMLAAAPSAGRMGVG